MTSLGGTPRKRYGLFVLAMLMLLGGAAALFFAWTGFTRRIEDFLIWSLGLFMIVASTYLVRTSNVRARPRSVAGEEQASRPWAGKRPGALLWLTGAASVIALVISYHYLYKDALGGYHQVWPVDVFAGVALICASLLAYLFSRLV
jgi:hypothetical protein